MALEVFYAYWDIAATPLLEALLDQTQAVSLRADLPPALELCLHQEAQILVPFEATALASGVVARLYGPGEELQEEAARVLAQGGEAWSLPTLGPAGPVLPPRPFTGRRVLVTRAANQAGGVLGALRLRGADAWLLPALRIAPAVDQAPLAEAIERLGTYRYVLFTSQNAVHEFLLALDAKAIDVRRLGDARLLAVGAATALALRARGLLAEIAREGTAQGLATQLAGRVRPGDRALLLGPEPPDADLAQGLSDHGLQVDVAPVYRTVRGASAKDAAALLRQGPPDAAVFYSPSAVEATRAAVPPGFLHGVPAVAIGPTTAAACLEHGLRLAAQAASPGLPGILLALRQVLPGPEASRAKE